jgi:hypothetical protein
MSPRKYPRKACPFCKRLISKMGLAWARHRDCCPERAKFIKDSYARIVIAGGDA